MKKQAKKLQLTPYLMFFFYYQEQGADVHSYHFYKLCIGDPGQYNKNISINVNPHTNTQGLEIKVIKIRKEEVKWSFLQIT